MTTGLNYNWRVTPPEAMDNLFTRVDALERLLKEVEALIAPHVRIRMSAGRTGTGKTSFEVTVDAEGKSPEEIKAVLDATFQALDEIYGETLK